MEALDPNEAFWRSLSYEDIEVHVDRTRNGLFKVWSADIKIGPVHLGTIVAPTKPKLFDKLAVELQAIERKIDSGERRATSEGLR